MFASVTPLIMRLLQALELNTSRLVTGTVAARILYLPAGTPCERGAVFNTQMLAALYQAKLQNILQPRDTIILQKCSIKRWLNQLKLIADAIEKNARLHSLRFVIFSDTELPTLAESISLYDCAVLVVAIHGSGISNMLFAQPGTPIIEIACHPINDIYRNMAQHFAQPYYAILPKYTCFDTSPEQVMPAVDFFLSN